MKSSDVAIDDVLPEGEGMHSLARRLFPIPRSLTGDGVRATLNILREFMPKLTIHEVPSGTPCFDWIVPREWNVCSAYLLDPEGRKIADFADNNLHLLGYSIALDRTLDLDELQNHLYSLPEIPDAIPYVTSYYEERWGFCLPHRLRTSLKPGNYRAVIDSTLSDGFLTYGELILPGHSSKEIFLSTYICHPSMANNELSGPCVATFLAKWLQSLDRQYTYRILFIPETIGSILYNRRNLADLRNNVIAGFNISCVGDERVFSFLPSRAGNTLADRVARHVLRHMATDYLTYSFLDRGSDERQYCAPGVDLPIASLMRSKYGTYPEYHTSLDNLDLVTPRGLAGSYLALRRCLEIIEADVSLLATTLCEPQMGRRGLYSTLGTRSAEEAVTTRMNILAYADGSASILDIADILEQPAWELLPCFRLEQHQLLKRTDTNTRPESTTLRLPEI